MSAIATIALTELRLAVRNRWIVLGTATLMLLALVLAFLGSAPAGTVKASPLAVNAVSLTSLAVYLVPLLALLLAYDAIIGEIERGTMLLLFTCPLSRASLIAGKFMGHLVVLALAVTIGFGSAIAFTALFALPGPDDILIALRLLATSVLLGAVFLTLGYLASVLARDRAGAAAIGIVLWLVLVLIYDLALLGMLSAEIGGDGFAWLLIVNPSDSFRLLNLMGFDDLVLVSGIAGAAQELPVGAVGLVVLMCLWMAMPLTLVWLLLRQREL